MFGTFGFEVPPGICIDGHGGKLHSGTWRLLSVLYQHPGTYSTRLLPVPDEFIDDPSLLVQHHECTHRFRLNWKMPLTHTPTPLHSL